MTYLPIQCSVAVSARQVSIGDYLALQISDKSGVNKVYFYHKDDLDTLVHTHSFGLNEHPQFNRGGLYVTDALNAYFVRMTGTGIVTLEITKVALSGTAVSGSILVDQSVIASKVYVDAETTARTAAIAAAIAQLTHFHSSVQTVTSSQATTNATATVNFTFSELSSAEHYSAYLNRTFLRPDEYSVSGTTVTIAIGQLIDGDELEVTGFSS